MTITEILNDCHHWLQEELNSVSNELLDETLVSFNVLRNFVREFSGEHSQFDKLIRHDLNTFNEIIYNFDSVKSKPRNVQSLNELLDLVEDARDTHYEVLTDGENTWNWCDEDGNEGFMTFATLIDAVRELEDLFIDYHDGFSRNEVSSLPLLDQYSIIRVKKGGNTQIYFNFTNPSVVKIARKAKKLVNG